MNYLIQTSNHYLIWIMLLSIPFLWYQNKKITTIQTFFSTGVAWFAAHAIKKIFPTPRPFVAEHLTPLINHPPQTGAFPSAHTAMAFAIATSIFIINKKWGLIAYIFAIAIGILRILALVHYPIDILGGAILGSAIALAINKLPQNPQKKQLTSNH